MNENEWVKSLNKMITTSAASTTTEKKNYTIAEAILQPVCFIHSLFFADDPL